jgi:hypothetical protein
MESEIKKSVHRFYSVAILAITFCHFDLFPDLSQRDTGAQTGQLPPAIPRLGD